MLDKGTVRNINRLTYEPTYKIPKENDGKSNAGINLKVKTKGGFL